MIPGEMILGMGALRSELPVLEGRRVRHNTLLSNTTYAAAFMFHKLCYREIPITGSPSFT